MTTPRVGCHGRCGVRLRSTPDQDHPMQPQRHTVTSADGTAIAVDVIGAGQVIILVGGAFHDRITVADLAAALAPHATAATYDRRGRGASGDNSGSDHQPVQHEVEDLGAVISRVGGHASIFGHSSGAVLALEAASRGLPVDRVVGYEPTYFIDPTRRPDPDFADQLRTLVGSGRRDDAAALFLTGPAGLPADLVAGLRASDMWNFFARSAHTLPYDVAICDPASGLPSDRLAVIRVPVLAINGSETDPWIAESTRAAASAIPNARHVVLEGHDHGVLHHAEALRGLIVDFIG
jgi:pimeloyl-ACP methyl ester carboxylesterase